MGGLGVAVGGVLLPVIAVAAERGAVRGLRAAWLAHSPLSGEHTDSVLYHRNLWTPGAVDVAVMLAALVASGWLALAAWQVGSAPLLWTAGLLWLAALAWDLWSWELVAGSVKFVSWRRGWRQSARRAAVSDVREVVVVERQRALKAIPAWLRAPRCYLVLRMNDGTAVKLPRTGGLFGGNTEVETLANFIRMQMDVVADNRRRAAADKRAAARQARLPQRAPLQPAQSAPAHRGDLW